MDSISLVVQAKYIAALKIFAAQKDIRYYLNGICVEVVQGDAYLVATDGHRLACYFLGAQAQKLTLNAIIPNNLFERIRAKGSVEITIDEKAANDSRPVSIFYEGVKYAGQSIVGRWPQNWRQMFHAPNNEAAQFNVRYLGDMAKAWHILTASRGFPPSIAFNGQSTTAMFNLGDDAFAAVLMPLNKFLPVLDSPPGWLLPKSEG